ncbi:shikimate dehydrogenase [Serpentinicella sp. ANB-PHB4]|uniref:shikimate dehydrogenase n=1 Tax=Serpentinicella sp. ANB-PHB4 TaxID=3074076 RepID=UPI002860A45A|nr:shikimate dehydrogenase [Serpentinicella sp. ANB-PHB4]MDR5658116.1 shikimate dehydrogenase [Serpentinicella sp. ANB-PHB4]
MINIDGKTKTVCLIGNPVAHSFSPFIHNFGFDLHKINAVYLAHNVQGEDLKQAVEGIKVLGYLGANVTYPHKTEIIKHLDELTESAKFIGAVNTIQNQNGKLIGHNTDGDGFVAGLKNKGHNLDKKTIYILGAGGAARSIIFSLCKTFQCNITLCNRNLEKAQQIQQTVNEHPNLLGKIDTCLTPDQIDTNKTIDVIINCTPIGMEETMNQIPFEQHITFNERMLVCDLIYQPYTTKLLQIALDHSAKVHYGLDMLIYQGILSFEIWTNETLPYNEIDALLKRKLY